MEKRKIIFGDYDTAANGWTLSEWQLSPPVYKVKRVEKPSGDGSWDLSTALTGGIPRYSDRTLTVTLERSDGDRLSRKAAVRDIVNHLDGQRVQIVLPDDPDYYLDGRLSVAKDYNDLAHAAVTVTAVCDPWLYAKTAREYRLTASTTAKTATLENDGRRAVVPVVQITGSSANVLLKFGNDSAVLTAGTYQVPAILLTSGTHSLVYSGSGSITITYREAVLE